MSLTLSLAGKTAVVSGGSRGIGRAVCLALGQAGADVVVGAGRDKAAAARVAGEVRDGGARSAVALGDLREPNTASEYVDVAATHFGKLDIVVNNAGIWEESSIDTLLPEDLENILAVNLKSAFRLCRHATPYLRQSPAGRIINVSSTASLMGEPLHSPYAASKGAMDAMTRSLAVELGPAGITVNSVAPGWTRTEMTETELATELGEKLIAEIPLGKVAEPEDVAYAVVFLASDWGGHISGVTLPVEGAYRIRR